MNALIALARSSGREALRYRGDLAGQTVFLLLLILLFAQLWNAVPRGEWSAGQLVVYLLVTELVTMSPRAVHVEIGREVRSGDLVVSLLRPVSHVGWILGRSIGASLATCAWLVVTAGPLTWLVAGCPALDWRGIAFGGLVLVPLAIAVETCARATIGVLAFWMEDSSPVYWVWQKAGFLLGGLLVPLHLYPDWLLGIARWTPFAAFYYGPARAVVAFDPGEALRTLGALLAWGGVLLAVLHLVHARAIRAVQSHGG